MALNSFQGANKIAFPHLEEPQTETSSSLYSELKQRILDEKILLTTHFYTPSIIQDLTLETNGIVSDSLQMAQVATKSRAEKIIVAGVKFMAETAKIMAPHKTVYTLDKQATCSLDEGCDPDEFATWRAQHPDRTVVVYTNTSAKIKMQADWVVTSTIAVPIIEHLATSQKILWAPDKHLGKYLQHKTDADMLLWDGACIVHEEFRADELKKLKNVYPRAAVLVHPESPAEVIELADVVGSTSQILQAAQDLEAPEFIIATDAGLFHQIRKQVPHKILIEAPTAGQGSQCRSCARCPWMAMNSLEALHRTLTYPQTSEIILPPEVCERAAKPIKNMLRFAEELL